MDTVFIIYRSLSDKEESLILQLAKKQTIKLYYDKSQFVSKKLRENKISAEVKKEASANSFTEEHLSRIASLGSTIVGSKTLSEHLAFNDTTLWLYLKFSVFHRSLSITQDIANIRYIESEHPSAQIKVYSDYSIPANYISSKVVQEVKQKKSSALKKASYLLQYALLFFSRVIIGLLQYPFRRKREEANVILTNPYNEQSILNKDGSDFIKSDPHLGYLIESSRKDDSFLLLSQIRALNFNQKYPFQFANYFKATKDSKRTIFFEPFLFLSLLNLSLYREYKQQKKLIDSLRRELENESFSDDFTRLSIETTIKSSKMLIQAVWRQKAAKLLLKYQNVRSLTLIDEHSLKNRSIWYPMQQQGVKIIAVQHGAISNGNVAYRFSEDDIQYHPLPNKTLVRGSFTFKMLSQTSIYREDQLIIVGHMRTDIIPNLLKKQESHSKKTIVYATQPVLGNDKKLKIQQIEDFFSACRALPEYDFILKPHPNESELGLYDSIAKRSELKNFRLSNEDLYVQLAKADIVITYFSTVGIEAIYFGKDLITLDYDHLDLQGYLKNEVSYNVHNADELIKAIQDLLDKKVEIAQSKKEQYIADRAFRIDGDATKRHLEAIKG